MTKEEKYSNLDDINRLNQPLRVSQNLIRRLRIPAIRLMQHQPGMQAGRRLAVLQGADNDPLGGLAGAGPEGNDLDRAETLAQPLDNFIGVIGAVNDGEAAAIFEIAKPGIEPVFQCCVFIAMRNGRGFFFRRRFRVRPGLQKWWITNDVIEQ